MFLGLNIKCIQVAARALGIPYHRITIHNNDTSRVPNAVPTGGSQGSDIFGLATRVFCTFFSYNNEHLKIACEELMRRIEPIRAANPEAKWEEITQKAYLSGIGLSATGFGV